MYDHQFQILFFGGGKFELEREQEVKRRVDV
jgi:hypothetical protein